MWIGTVGMVAVEDLIREECIRTLRRGAIEDSIRLSRRHRWKPLAMHVHDHMGAVLVARRGKRAGLSVRAHCFDLRDDPPTPVRLPAGFDEDAPTIEQRRSLTDLSGAPFMTAASIGHVEWWCVCMQLASEVRTWRLGGEVHAVADHGWIVVIGYGQDGPRIQFFDGQGGVIDPDPHESPPVPPQGLPYWPH